MFTSLYRPSASVFWPLECEESGFAFGWCDHQQREQTIVVAGVVQVSASTVDSETRAILLQCLRTVQQHVDIAEFGELKLIGRCSYLSGQRKGLTVPVLELVDIRPGIGYNIVFYHQHQSNTLRFYSMDGLGLDIDAFNDNVNTSVQPALRQNSGISQSVVNRLNLASIINAAVLESSLSTSNARPLGSKIRRTAETITFHFSNAVEKALAISQTFFFQPFQVICNTHVLSKLLLKDVSLGVHQMDVRVDQLTVLFQQMVALRLRKEGGRIESFSIRYTSFFNTVWLIVNDVTIGYAFGNFLCENHEVLATILREVVDNILISWPQRALLWLDSWPAGLKLNTELSRFYSGTFVDLVDVWGGVLQRLIFPHLSKIIYIFGLISSFGAFIGGMGGMTMSIALFYDMFAVFTLHIYVCYAIALVAYERALWGLGSLWRLFRGKRFNVLRNRTDSWEYDNDQLLFGTILFTLLAFLFPTVLAYYALFALLRLSTIFVQASLEIQLAFMNHFPLFALVLKLKDPWRLPGGLYFDFIKVRVHTNSNKVAGVGTSDNDATPLPGDPNEATPKNAKPPFENARQLVTTLIPVLESQPLTFSRIFFQYTHLWTKLASHYSPLRLFKSLLLGNFLVPIPRYEIRYDKIGRQ